MNTIEKIYNLRDVNQTIKTTESCGVELNTFYRAEDKELYQSASLSGLLWDNDALIHALSPLPIDMLEGSDKLFLLRIRRSVEIYRDMFRRNFVFFERIEELISKYPNLVLDMDDKKTLGILKAKFSDIKIATEEVDREFSGISDYLYVPNKCVNSAINNILNGRKVILREWDIRGFNSPLATVIRETNGSDNLYIADPLARVLALNMGFKCDGKAR